MDLLQLIIVSFFMVLSPIKTYALQSEAVLGGELAPPCTYKYQVALVKKKNGFQVCGGAIINANHVITAAHCVQNRDCYTHKKEELVVYAGTHNIDELAATAVKSKIEKIYFFYINKSHKIGDIALLKLKTRLPLENNECLGTVRLSGDNYNNQEAIITGFGQVALTNHRQPASLRKEGIVIENKLRVLRTRIISNSECLMRYRWYSFRYLWKFPSITINTAKLCTKAVHSFSDSARGSCSGDSGGPIVIDGDILVGIISMGPMNCDEYYSPGIHTRVSSYRYLIEKILEINDEEDQNNDTNTTDSDDEVRTYIVHND